MTLWVNLGFFIIAAFTLIVNLLFPFFNLHLANSTLACLKYDVNQIITEQRNTPDQIETKLENRFKSAKFFDLLGVETKDINDFKVIELEFKYKLLFNGMNDSVKKQKMRFIVNDV